MGEPTTVRAISLLALAIWLAVAGLGSAAGDQFAAMAVQTTPNPAPSPPLSLPDLAGRVVGVPEKFRGRVVVLGFFTTT